MRKKVNKGASVPALTLVAALLLVGCKEKQQTPAPPPQAKPAAKAPLPVQKQASSARVVETAEQLLDFTNKKDPFKPFMPAPVIQSKAKPTLAGRAGDILPIQAYDVDKFTVSGIIIGLRENTALIIDPAGKGYVVKEGMLIGNNDGRISRIGASSIEVVEQYRDDSGRIRKRTVVLALHKKK